MKKLTKPGFVAGLLLLFILGVGIVQAADYRYFSVLAETMRPIDSTIGFDCDEGYLQTISDSTLHTTQYIAQVNLPHGSTIENVSCYGFDNDSNDFSFALFRYRFNGDGVNVFEQITDQGNSGAAPVSYVDLTVDTVTPPVPPGLAVVNNEDYSYGIYLSLPAPDSQDLYVVRFLVRAQLESLSSFKSIEIK